MAMRNSSALSKINMRCPICDNAEGAEVHDLAVDHKGSLAFVVVGSAKSELKSVVRGALATLAVRGDVGPFEVDVESVGALTAGTETTIRTRQRPSLANQILFTFSAPVNNVNSANTETKSGFLQRTTTAFNGNQLGVTVGNSSTGVPNACRIALSEAGVNGLSDALVRFSTRSGDVSGNGIVNSTDVGPVNCSRAYQ